MQILLDFLSSCVPDAVNNNLINELSTTSNNFNKQLSSIMKQNTRYSYARVILVLSDFSNIINNTANKRSATLVYYTGSTTNRTPKVADCFIRCDHYVFEGCFSSREFT